MSLTDKRQVFDLRLPVTAGFGNNYVDLNDWNAGVNLTLTTSRGRPLLICRPRPFYGRGEGAKQTKGIENLAKRRDQPNGVRMRTTGTGVF